MQHKVELLLTWMLEHPDAVEEELQDLERERRERERQQEELEQQQQLAEKKAQQATTQTMAADKFLSMIVEVCCNFGIIKSALAMLYHVKQYLTLPKGLVNIRLIFLRVCMCY